MPPKEATLNPTNLRDRPTDWEADLIHSFRNRAEQKEISGERDTPTGRLPYVAHPIRIESPAVLPAPGSTFSEGCSFIGAVLFSDVCAAPTPAEPPAEALHKQRRQLLAKLVSQAIGGVPTNSRLAANTREGCAVCYVGDPEDALRTSSRLGAAASEHGLDLHIGINLGPVRVQPDPAGRSRLLGDGVASAFRVMRFAKPGQLLVSAAYVDLIAQLRRGDLFHRTGPAARPAGPGTRSLPLRRYTDRTRFASDHRQCRGNDGE